LEKRSSLRLLSWGVRTKRLVPVAFPAKEQLKCEALATKLPTNVNRKGDGLTP
jgi:hypothetical protein